MNIIWKKEKKREREREGPNPFPLITPNKIVDTEENDGLFHNTRISPVSQTVGCKTKA